MKRTISLLIVVCSLLLCACGPKYEVPYASTTETTTAATTEATTEETEAPQLYYHPLTGAVLSAPYTARPTAVVINNIKACLPQYGISAADMIYEFETEGGITRMLALFTDLSNVDSIGPIRSARTYFSNVSASYDIPLIHCGGSSAALSGKYDQTNTLKKWDHIDQVSNGSYFFRDTERRKQGYALEHTLFTTGEKLTQALVKKEYNTVYESAVDYGLQFADAPVFNGEAANKVTVTFRGKKPSTFTYSADSGVYSAAQYGKDHVDAGSGKTMAYRNILVLEAEQTINKLNGKSRSFYDLIGEGEGYFACDGKIVPIKWSRSEVTENFVYTLTDGTPVTLGVGKTYVGVIDIKAPAGVTYE